MMNRERTTALVSAMTAIAILGAMVTAEPSRPTASDRIASLESDLRYQIELGARIDAALAGQQQARLDTVMDAWRQAPPTPENHQVMTDWLRTALLRSLPGESGQWPDGPQFAAAKQSAPAGAAHATTTKTARKPAAVSASPKKGAPIAISAAEPLRAEPLSRAAVKGIANVPVGRLIRGEQEAPRLSVQATPSHPAAADKPAKKIADSQKSIPAKPAQTAEPRVEAPTFVPEATPGAATEVHSIVKSADRPAPTPAQTQGVYKLVAAEPPGAAKDVKPAPVELNLVELNARIGGYHEGLREIEAAIVAERESMSVTRVAELVARVEELAVQYEFIQLYYQVLSNQERQWVTAPRSMVDTIELVERQRAHVEAAADDHFSQAGETEGSKLASRLQAVAKIAGGR